jgi:hypothetical protein
MLIWWMNQLKTGEFRNPSHYIIDVMMKNSKSKSPIYYIFLHLGSFYSDNSGRFSKKIVGLFPIFKNIKDRQFFHNLLIKMGIESVNNYNGVL